MFETDPEPKKLKKSKVWLLYMYRKFNLIMALISVVFNILFISVMIINFNAGFILFVINTYNMSILLLKYKHESRSRRKS